MATNKVIRFLLQNAECFVSKPINGCVLTIHQLFASKYSKFPISLENFLKQLDEIKRLDKHCIIFKDELNIEFINPLNLKIMLDFNNSQKQPKLLPYSSSREKGELKLTVECLEDLLAPSAKPKSSLDYSNLQDLLDYETSCHKLTKFNIAKITMKVPFLETCNDTTHSEILSKQQQQQQQNGKIPKDLQNCLQLKIHYIPMIKSHTDISLGDCSYLDTCHRLESCRYVHYVKHIPKQEYQKQLIEVQKFNSKRNYYEKINSWSKNGSVSNLARDVLEGQWINCDIRKFNFNILGKFAAVIADPPWNIHMNLPYGTCNDNELLNLPLNNIQDEGIILLWVTGRAIEIGKESLMKWGYKIKNEVIWIKSNQLSRTICTGRTGHWLNHSKEHLIVGVKGDPQWLNKLIDVDYIVSQTRETSRKPDELYGMVERLVGPHARKLEIFGRDHNIRPGWFSEYFYTISIPGSCTNTHKTAIGNQVTGNNIVEVDVKERFKKLI